MPILREKEAESFFMWSRRCILFSVLYLSQLSDTKEKMMNVPTVITSEDTQKAVWSENSYPQSIAVVAGW